MSEEQWPPESGLPSKRRFKKAKDLRWGETPFDTLTRAELLRLVQAYHMALTSTRGCLKMAEALQPGSPYWGSDGSGGRALKKADALMSLCGDGGMNAASERIYRMFFRSAEPLLFGAEPGSFDDWCIKVAALWSKHTKSGDSRNRKRCAPNASELRRAPCG